MANCIWIVLFVFLVTFCTFTYGGIFHPPSQEERVFTDVCGGCRVSNGFGFNLRLTDCNCYYLCVNKRSFKLASYASPWVSYLRCCPCGQSFSWKLLTCVDFTDKRSVCYEGRPNPCNDISDGDLIPRSNPNHAGPGPASYLCSGYYECKSVGDIIVPNAQCCPDGECFDRTNLECNVASCDEGYCDDLRVKDDCECEQTSAPESECAFTEHEDDVTKFMGVENMKTYNCAPGTCWSQELCTCVRTNNTGYDKCDPFAKLDFSASRSATDGRGNTIWTEFVGDVDIVNDEAVFGEGGYIYIGGLANTYYSNTFIMHMKFRLTGSIQITTIGQTIPDYTECLFGNCVLDGIGGLGSLNAVIHRNGFSQKGYAIGISIYYVNSGISIDETRLKFLLLEAEYELDVEYKLLLVYHGPEKETFAGVFDEDGVIISDVIDKVPDSQYIKSYQSGVAVGGGCAADQSLQGVVTNFHMYRQCKPFGDPEFFTSFHDLYDAVHLGGHDF